jgi:hypothetical protein
MISNNEDGVAADLAAMGPDRLTVGEVFLCEQSQDGTSP